MTSKDNSLSGTKIVKNTIVLYFRMFLLMLISLYTSRVVLHLLGEDDFGIYNVVGGVVAMFAILSQSLSTAISRFLTFELGRNNSERLSDIFSASLMVQILLAFILIIVAEPLSIWFLNTRMQIPPERLSAANRVLQSSLIIFAINLVGVTFNSAIIAHEKMSAFAYISLFEAVLKLSVAFLLGASSFDKLKTYAVLMLVVDLIIKSIYIIYCYRSFEECRCGPKYNHKLLKEIGSFAGWNFIGNGVWIINTQGINILTNMFFGVKVNAARGIASQVNNAVQQFVNNFTAALNPQITKSYAKGEYSFMNSLVFSGAKFSYYLMFFFALPLCLETEEILSLWLHKVPDYAIIFVRLTLVASLCTVTADTLVRVMFATGKIKKYQIVVGLVGMLDFPLTYIAFKLGCPPSWGYIIYILIYFVLIFVRLFLVRELVNISIRAYIKEVLLRLVLVSLAASVFPFIFINFLPASLLRLFFTCIISSFTCLFSVYFLGLSNAERMFIRTKILDKLKKFRV